MRDPYYINCGNNVDGMIMTYDTFESGSVICHGCMYGHPLPKYVCLQRPKLKIKQ